MHPDASTTDYQMLQRRLGTQRNVIVQPSAYGADNRLLVEALSSFGSCARGVAVLEPGTSQVEIGSLHAAGVRGARFNLLFDSQDCSQQAIWDVSERITDLGWHLELCARPEMILALRSTLERLHVPIVIAHMGLLPSERWEHHAAFELLAEWAVSNICWIKLSGPYLQQAWCPDETYDVQLAHEFLRLAPDRIVWGSDWPHPNRNANEKPDDALLLDWLFNACGSADLSQRVLVKNPAVLYGWQT